METAKRNPDAIAPLNAGQPPRENNHGIVYAENRIEQLVAAIGQTIREAEPERRIGLREMADTLLREEVSSIVDTPSHSVQRRFSSNPLFAGLLLIVLGAGFLLILPATGLTLAFIGVLLAAWGGFMSWFRK